MADVPPEVVEHVLLLLTAIGRIVRTSAARWAPDPQLSGDAALFVVCALHVYGPQRRTDLVADADMPPGDVRGALDALEAAGLVAPGPVVALTASGRAAVSRLSLDVATALPRLPMHCRPDGWTTCPLGT